MIHYDRSANYILLFCDECPHWHAFTWTRDDADDAAARHIAQCHPDDPQVKSRRTSRRHAQNRKSSKS